jgi:hypothetical protein
MGIKGISVDGTMLELRLNITESNILQSYKN